MDAIDDHDLEKFISYFLHIVIFLPWSFAGKKFIPKRVLWLICGLLIASGLEVIQLYLPYRSFNIWDVVTNNIGVVSGYLLTYLYDRIKFRNKYSRD